MEPVRPERQNNQYIPIESRKATQLVIAMDHVTKNSIQAPGMLRFELRLLNWLDKLSPPITFAANTLGYAWLAGLAALTQG